jgi:hypothetical protein
LLEFDFSMPFFLVTYLPIPALATLFRHFPNAFEPLSRAVFFAPAKATPTRKCPHPTGQTRIVMAFANAKKPKSVWKTTP